MLAPSEVLDLGGGAPPIEISFLQTREIQPAATAASNMLTNGFRDVHSCFDSQCECLFTRVQRFFSR
jgi:hypothetical protein